MICAFTHCVCFFEQDKRPNGYFHSLLSYKSHEEAKEEKKNNTARRSEERQADNMTLPCDGARTLNLKHLLGFKDTLSMFLWISICGLTVVAILVRTPLMTEKGMRRMAPPGEEFELRGVRSTFVAHLALLVPWSVLATLQFVPTVRKALSYRYHRLAGRVFLVLTIAITATGLAMASKAFGGGFSSKVGMFVLSLSIILAVFQGFCAIRVKDIPSHRDWMLRLFAYATSVLTLRLFMFLGMQILIRMGGDGRFTTTRCDVIHELSKLDVASSQPGCEGASGDTVVVIAASPHSSANIMAGLRMGYESSIILALFVNASFVELWIRVRYYSRKSQVNTVGFNDGSFVIVGQRETEVEPKEGDGDMKGIE